MKILAIAVLAAPLLTSCLSTSTGDPAKDAKNRAVNEATVRTMFAAASAASAQYSPK